MHVKPHGFVVTAFAKFNFHFQLTFDAMPFFSQRLFCSRRLMVLHWSFALSSSIAKVFGMRAYAVILKTESFSSQRFRARLSEQVWEGWVSGMADNTVEIADVFLLGFFRQKSRSGNIQKEFHSLHLKSRRCSTIYTATHSKYAKTKIVKSANCIPSHLHQAEQ